MTTASPDLLRSACEPLCSAAGLDLEALEVSQAGRRRRVLLVVDRDGGVDLDECAELSRAVSDAFDAEDLMGESSYTLEVSSPGVSRPLTLPRHWRRNTGRLVRVVLAAGGEVTGRVVDADDQGAHLDVGGSWRRLPYAEVGRARVQVEFRRDRDDGTGDGEEG
jgi:ribosome maturation factor RimP